MDVNTVNRKFQKELLSGITSLVLLSALGQQEDPTYGYEIARSLMPAEGEPIIKQGALYPVLRSLEKSGLLTSSVEPSVSGPPRKYYTITEPGRQTLSEWISIWSKFKTYADDILAGDHHDN